MVSENQVISSVRIKFKKYGSLMYISHLDLARTMQRIIVRSGIDIWYSEGFNPQPKIVFAVPLPVGVESECEYMDIKLNSFMDCDSIKKRLSENVPGEMEIVDVYEPSEKFKNIAYIDYDITISSPQITSETALKIEELFSGDAFVTKKSKGSEKQINVREYIQSFSVLTENNFLKIKAIICSGSDKNLNPELLVEAIRKNTNILNNSLLDEYYSITRKEMLCADLTIFK